MALDRLAAQPARRRPAQRHRRGHVGHQHVARQRRLARARHPRDRHQPVQRHIHRHAAQVVQRRVEHRQPRRVRQHLAALLDRMHQRLGQEAARQRFRVLRDLLGRALGDHAAAALAGARADVDDVVGAADRVLVVLDHHQRVALVAQRAQGVQQDLVVARMQADGRLVQHVAHALQVAAELRRQPDALRLAARQGRRRAVQRQVAQADLLEELQAAADLADHVARDLRVAAAERQPGDPLARLGHAPRGDRADGLVLEAHRARHRVQPRAVAIGARRVAEVLDLGLLGREALLAAAVVLVLLAVVVGALRCSRVSARPVPTQVVHQPCLLL